MSLPVSPLCEEVGFNLAKSQQGFISYLVKPTIEPFAAFADGSEWIEQLEENFQMWKLEEEKKSDGDLQGIPEDIV